MTRIEKQILNENPYREMTHEEVIETLRLALKEAKEKLTPVELAQEIMKEFSLEEVKKALSSLRRGNY